MGKFQVLVKESGSSFVASYPKTKASQIRPVHMELRYTDTYTSELLGHTDLAIADLNLAEKNDPDLPEIYINRGMVYRDLGKNDEAIQDFSKAIKIDPSFSTAF